MILTNKLSIPSDDMSHLSLILVSDCYILM